MSLSVHCPLAATLARQLRAEREVLVHRWLDRITDRVALEPNRIFPTEELLDHVPLLIDGISDYLEDPADEITTDIPVIAKAIELGELRHTQGFAAHEILREYEILGGVLFSFLTRVVDGVDEPCSRGELLACSHRIFRAIAVIQQVTTRKYLQLTEQSVREREERLRGFNRAISHELKNRMGAAGGAAEMLQEEWIAGDPAQVKKFASMIRRNVGAMQETLQTLVELSKMDPGSTHERNVLLPDVAAEVKRQLRDFAESRQVRIEIADLPPVEVPAATLELALSNYVTNAIKYRDRAKTDWWVRIEADLRSVGEACTAVVRVRDNGPGIPEAARERLFDRFFRAAEAEAGDEEGSGLGLSIVRETIAHVGGRAWAEFPKEGSVFALSIPCHRTHAKGDGAR